MVDDSEIADGLVHESIHALLYMEEARQGWITDRALDVADRVVLSPWSGNMISIRSFLQACFVWYGLASFWAKVLDRAPSSPFTSAPRLLARAVKGFAVASLTNILANYGTGISATVIEAILNMQANILKALEPQ